MPDLLHFRRDMSDIDWDQMIGPDFGKRYLRVSLVEYHTGTGISTVTLRGILPDEFRTRIEPIVAEQRERERIQELFVG